MRGSGMADHHENPLDTADRTPEAVHSRRTTTNDSSTNHASRDEQQVLLPVVEEAERAFVVHFGLRVLGHGRAGGRGGTLLIPLAGVPAAGHAAHPGAGLGSCRMKDRPRGRPHAVACDQP